MQKFEWIAKDESKEEFTCVVNGRLLSVQRLMKNKWWWCVYSSSKEMLLSSYTKGKWCENVRSAKELAENSYLSLPDFKNNETMDCIHCECEFVLPQGNKGNKLLHSINYEENEQKHYMCEDCYIERAEAEHRYVHGVKICVIDKCGRDALEFSDYCEICLQEHNN